MGYKEWHLRYGVDNEAATPWHLEVRKRLPQNLGDALEIGCGRGGFSCWLAENTVASSIIAMDFAETAVRMDREHAARLGTDTTRVEI